MDLQQRKGEIYENNISFSWNNNMGNVQSAYPVSFYMHRINAISVEISGDRVSLNERMNQVLNVYLVST